MSKLQISNELKLPADMVTQTFAILAKRRVGKTYTASVIAEEMVKVGLPFVVLDPTGAWWGLRSSADGTVDGLPVIILGGQHGDIPLEFTAGRVIADLVVDQPGFYVIDTSGSESDAQQDKFAEEFAMRLYRRKDKKREPLHLFIDEADMFAPQKPFPNQTKMLGAFEALVRRGGIRGIGVTMITQRPAVLNKNVLTQIECLIILQMTAPQDQDAIEDWIRRNGTREQRDMLMASLASLGRGEAWIWSPAWLEIFKKIHVRERRTFNSSATPKAGETPIQPERLAPVDLEQLRERIAATLERAKQEDPAELRKQIADLNRKLRERPIEPKVETKIEYRDRAALTVEERQNLGELELTLRALSKLFGEISQKAIPQLAKIAVDLRAALEADARIKATPAPQMLHAYRRVERRTARVDVMAEGDATIQKPHQDILDALATLEAFGIKETAKVNIAALVGKSAKSSGYTNNLGGLRSSGLIQYFGGGLIGLTDAGRACATPRYEISAVGDLHRAWYAVLDRPKAAILQVLIGVYPSALDKEDLSSRASEIYGKPMSPTSSGFTNNLGALRSLGVIRYVAGAVAATELLYPEGLSG